MGLKLNPLTAQFDLVGSGGGGASYIDGEVATYNDLPLSSTTAPLNTAWLVRGSSGIWPFTKPGGVYVRTATGGSSRDADYTYAGIFPDVFSDAQFTLYDDADTSKNLKFQLSGISTGTTRTLTAPNASGTIALTSDIPAAFDPASPGTIGGTTPAAATFTNLTANTRVNLPNTNGTTAGDIYRNANTLRYRDSTNTERLLLNATDNLANLASAATSRTNLGLGSSDAVTFGSIQNTPIGSTTASTGAFTTLSATPASNTTALTSTGYSLTGSNAQSLVDLAGTWNTTGVPIAFKTNLTVTAAGSNSMYADFQVGGYSQFGVARISGTSNALWLYNSNSGTNTNGIGANYERGVFAWASNVLRVGTERLGTGTNRSLDLITDGTTRLTISGGGQFVVGAGSRLAFGGSTSSSPALKPSGTTLQVRLADDSAFAPFECAGLTLNGNLTASTRNIVTDTTTGTRIGTGTTQLLGFWNAAPSAQPAAVADATDAASAITQLNALLSRLRTIGIIAT